MEATPLVAIPLTQPASLGNDVRTPPPRRGVVVLAQRTRVLPSGTAGCIVHPTRSADAVIDIAPRPPRDTAQSSDIPACRNSGSVSRSSARITGPIRCRVTSQRREPGSHTPPARCRMWAKSCGHRTATMRPNSANSTGPMRAGRGGGERTGDPGHERRAGTIVRASPREATPNVAGRQLITATLGVSSYPVRRIPLPIGTAPGDHHMRR